MGAILDFRGARGRKADDGRRRISDRTAEIVIFPGVRIERWSDDTDTEDPYEDEGPRDPGQRGRS